MKIQKKFVAFILIVVVSVTALNAVLLLYFFKAGFFASNPAFALYLSIFLNIILLSSILLYFYIFYIRQYRNLLSALLSYNVNNVNAENISLLEMIPKDNFGNLKSSINNLLIKINEDRSRISRSENIFRTVFEKAPMGIALSNANECSMIRLNARFRRILKLDPSGKDPVNWEAITHPEDVQSDKHNMKLLVSGEIDNFQMYKRYILNDGSIVWVNMIVAKINSDNPDVPMAICMVNDITEYKEKENEILNLTYNDSLTGLKNRNFYDKKVREFQDNKNSVVSVIIGDINGLKMMNDGFGHHYGDIMLKTIAGILKKTLRETDFICRIGGDEFCVFLPDTSKREAEELCDRITGACMQYSEMDERDIFYLSISLGCAAKNSTSENIGEVIITAEENMQRNKLKNRKEHRLLFLESMTSLLLERKLDSVERMNRLSSMSNSSKEAFNLTNEEVYNLVLLSNFHNIGKVSIPEYIFHKKDHLSDIEVREIKKHPNAGYRIAMAISEFIPVADLVLSHHERFDGRGYPQGISGNQIPKLSRIFSLFDAYDAMTNPRPYRKAMSKDEALNEIRINSGSQFDPDLATIFIKWISS